MSIEQEKFRTLNKLRKDTFQSTSNVVSQLSALADQAIKIQAYMHKNPDLNGADTLIPVVNPDFFATSVAFDIVKGKLEDMQAVGAGTMTADELITKHSVNLAEYSEELI